MVVVGEDTVPLKVVEVRTPKAKAKRVKERIPQGKDPVEDMTLKEEKEPENGEESHHHPVAILVQILLARHLTLKVLATVARGGGTWLKIAELS